MLGNALGLVMRSGWAAHGYCLYVHCRRQ